MNKKLYVFAALIFVLSISLAACGGGDDDGDDNGAAGGDIQQAGQELFAQTEIEGQAGCITCHSLEPDVVVVGPSMAGVGTRAETRVEGMSATEYLRESIVEPDAYVVEGFPAGTMPDVWGEVLTEDQIDFLVDYLSTLK